MKRARPTQSGFTLIELMVVVLIIGLLVAIALPNFAAMTDRARISSLKGNCHTLQVTIESDSVDRGQYAAATTEIVNSDAYKVFANPLTNAIGPGAPGNGAWCLSTDGASDGAALPGGFTGGPGTAGQVVYVPVTEQGLAVSTAAGTRNATAGQARAYLIFGVGLNDVPAPRSLIASGLLNGIVPANAAALQP